MRKASEGARAAALQVLLNGGSQAALDDELRRSRLHIRDRALATEIVYGAMKRRRSLIWSLQRHLHREFDTLDAALQWDLLIAAYQILYLERIPVHSAVDESVTLARRFGHAGTAAFANAVLRKLARDRVVAPKPKDVSDVAAFADYASLPDWLAKHFFERFGFDDALRAADGLNARPRRAVRVNGMRASDEQISEKLLERGIVTSPSRYGIEHCLVIEGAATPDSLDDLVAGGEVTVQSEESQLAIQLLEPKKSMMVVDVCAGRGRKCGGIAERMHDPKTLYAIDDEADKLAFLRTEMQRLGLSEPIIICADARQPFPPIVPAADAILIDAPCSGIGIIGRHPEARWTKTDRDPQRLQAVQSAILSQAAAHVRPDGVLMYVTCSTDAREDEDVVNAFLESSKEWESIPLDLTAPPHTTRSIGNFVLTIPGIDGADGFFFASLRRLG